MASSKLLSSFILFCLLSSYFIFPAAGRTGSQGHHWRRGGPRHLWGGGGGGNGNGGGGTTPFPCFKKNNCNFSLPNISLNEPNIFELESRTDTTFQLDIGANFTSLRIAFEADHEDVKAFIVIAKPFPARPEGVQMTTSDEKATAWQISIPGETIKGHQGESVTIKIENRHRTKAIVKLTLSFEILVETSFSVLMIALAVVGGFFALIVVGCGAVCYLRKKRRNHVQVEFPAAPVSQHQSNSIHAPNSFQQIDAQQQRLIQQQLILQQQLLLLQQQHMQLRESQRFARPQSPSVDQPQQEPDQGQQLQEVTMENLNTRFPETFYEYIDSPLSQTICSICLEEMKTKTICRQLDCNHVFHSECIKQWLVNRILKGQSVNCPNCNRDVTEAPQPAKNDEIHDSHVILMIPDNVFE